MADAVTIRCPECRKKFKGKSELDGKRVRCPHCSEPFVVELDGDEETPRRRVKSSAIRDKKKRPAKPEAPPPVPPPSVVVETPPPPAPVPAPTHDPFDDDDDGGNPYTIEHVEIKARCPNCAKEMLHDKAVVCVFCGYNTLTREIGKTQKTFSITGKEHFMHLLPGMAAAAFIILQIVGVLFYCLVLPYHSHNNWLSFSNSEAMRLWTTIFALMDTWPAAMYAYHRLVINPKPKERAKDD